MRRQMPIVLPLRQGQAIFPKFTVGLQMQICSPFTGEKQRLSQLAPVAVGKDGNGNVGGAGTT